jgi:hypothetical protein
MAWFDVGPVEREVELLPLAAEVLVELSDRGCCVRRSRTGVASRS